jgi:hypothetical protein
MSRAGRRARRQRLIDADQWTPSSSLPGPADGRLTRIIAERDGWIREAGLLGWRREQNRRRAPRIATTRRRLAAGDPEPQHERLGVGLQVRQIRARNGHHLLTASMRASLRGCVSCSSSTGVNITRLKPHGALASSATVEHSLRKQELGHARAGFHDRGGLRPR